MSEPEEVEALPGQQISRFDVNERLVHWTTAILLLSLLVTGTILYVPSLMLKVGHRATIVNIHVITGLALVAPIALGLAGSWRARLVKDLRRLDRWKRTDFAYFRRTGGPRTPAGKFNGGQKLGAAVFGGGMAAMVVTGIVMRWSPPFPNSWASGATLLHDTFYLVLFALVIGHVAMALSRPEQMKSMLSGRISRTWAERQAPDWLSGNDLKGSRGRDRAPARTRPQPSARRDEAVGAGRTQASG